MTVAAGGKINFLNKAGSGATNAIVMNNTGISVASTGKIEVKSSGTLDIGSTGVLKINATNFKFNVNDDNALEITGKVTATSGLIGGWDVQESWLWNGGGSGNSFTLVGLGGDTSDTRYDYIKDYFMYCGADYPDAPHTATSQNGYAPFKIVRNKSGYTSGTVESRYTCLGNQTYDKDGVCNGGYEGELWVWAYGYTEDKDKNKIYGHNWKKVDISALPFVGGWKWGDYISTVY